MHTKKVSILAITLLLSTGQMFGSEKSLVSTALDFAGEHKEGIITGGVGAIFSGVSYWKGRRAGWKKGYDVGHGEGYQSGYDVGKKEGINEGREQNLKNFLKEQVVDEKVDLNTLIVLDNDRIKRLGLLIGFKEFGISTTNDQVVHDIKNLMEAKNFGGFCARISNLKNVKK